MGEKLVREALEYVKSPDALTTPERLALVKLAADADDKTRECPDLAPGREHAMLIAKGALELRGDRLFFTEMDLADAYKAYRVMSGVEEEAARPSSAQAARGGQWEVTPRQADMPLPPPPQVPDK